VRARRYRDRATENLHLAETAPSFDVRQRYFKVARHYLHMAELEERDAKRVADKVLLGQTAENAAEPADEVAVAAHQVTEPVVPAERAA
jgi:hypothetical protein